MRSLPVFVFFHSYCRGEGGFLECSMQCQGDADEMIQKEKEAKVRKKMMTRGWMVAMMMMMMMMMMN